MKRTTEGLIQTYKNPIIHQIMLRFNGDCTISFLNGTEKTWRIPCDPVYIEQYGIPLSADGRFMAIPSWEMGISVYSTKTGALLWKHLSKKIRQVFFYQDSIAAVKCGESIFQLNLADGHKMREIRSSSIEAAYDLRDGLVLVCSIKGKYSLIHMNDFTIVRQFSKSTIDPNKCLSTVITGATVENGKIIMHGFEYGSNMDPADRESRTFQRVLCEIE